MNTNTMTQEQISALVDNELSDEHVELALAALRQADQRVNWDLYHQIGDVMRSDEMAHEFSPDFNARLMARLDAEPTIIAPPLPKPEQQDIPLRMVGGANGAAVSGRNGGSFRRFAMPTAAAAVAVFALMSGPQFWSAMKHGVGVGGQLPEMADNSTHQGIAPDITVSDATQNGVMLRDPKMDEYLLAHQRFSPSLYSTAQYARSATFAPDSDR